MVDKHLKVDYKCEDCGHVQQVTHIHTEFGVYAGSGANWCDLCSGKPLQVFELVKSLDQVKADDLPKPNESRTPEVHNQILITEGVANRVLSALVDLLPDPKDKNHGGHGAQDVSRWRAAAADLRKTLQAERQAPAQPCIACGNEAGHSENCARVRWGVASPGQSQQSMVGQPLETVLREALAWGKVYGAELSGTAWDTMREDMVKTFSARVAVTSLEASGVPHE